MTSKTFSLTINLFGLKIDQIDALQQRCALEYAVFRNDNGSCLIEVKITIGILVVSKEHTLY